MPCCDGIWFVGIGTSIITLGITIGTMPSHAYFSSISPTRPSAGVAGNGKPLKSICRITTLKSSPVIDSVECAASAPGSICCCVTTPSISTEGAPPTVTITTTRRMLMGADPPVSRNSVSSGERLLMVKRS